MAGRRSWDLKVHAPSVISRPLPGQRGSASHVRLYRLEMTEKAERLRQNKLRCGARPVSGCPRESSLAPRLPWEPHTS